MNNDILIEYIDLAFSMILADTPTHTYNLKNNTKFVINGNEATIIISAPLKTKKGKTDYAPYVNYNRKRSDKEKKNYHYVENNLIEACKIIAEKYGGIFINEL